MDKLIREILVVASSLDKKGEYAIADELDQLASYALSLGEEDEQEEVPDEALQIVPQAPQMQPEAPVEQEKPQMEMEQMPQPFGGQQEPAQEMGESAEPTDVIDTAGEATELIQVLQDAGYSDEKLMQLVESI